MPTKRREGAISRIDHCFLFAIADGDRGMAFCRAELDGRRARSEVEAVLREVEGYREFELAYLGLLDYRDMEAAVAAMLEPFEKRDPVWFVRFHR